MLWHHNICHVVSESWVNNCEHGAEFPDALATHLVMSSSSGMRAGGTRLRASSCGPLLNLQQNKRANSAVHKHADTRKGLN